METSGYTLVYSGRVIIDLHRAYAYTYVVDEQQCAKCVRAANPMQGSSVCFAASIAAFVNIQSSLLFALHWVYQELLS